MKKPLLSFFPRPWNETLQNFVFLEFHISAALCISQGINEGEHKPKATGMGKKCVPTSALNFLVFTWEVSIDISRKTKLFAKLLVLECCLLTHYWDGSEVAPSLRWILSGFRTVWAQGLPSKRHRLNYKKRKLYPTERGNMKRAAQKKTFWKALTPQLPQLTDILTRTKGVVVDDWEFKIARLVQKNISHSYDCVEKEMGIFNEVQFSISCPQYLTNLLCSAYFFICAVLEVKFGKSQLW